GIEEASYVGLSTELMIPSRGSDRNNIFWSSKIGSGGVALSTAPIIFPSFVRLGSGFAVPGAESIIFVDSDLRAKKRFTASNLRPEVQATSASSANHRHGAFVFNIAN